MKRGSWIIAVAVGALVFGVGAWLLLRNSNPAPTGTPGQTTQFHDEATGLNLTYDAKLFEGELDQEDKDAKVVFRLLQPVSQTPLQLTVSYDTGKAAAATATKQGTHRLILDSAKLTKPGEYDGYELLSEKVFEVNGYPAAELVFTYTTETKVTQRFVIIERDPDTVIYLTAQAKSEDFDSINSAYFDPIVNSISFD